MARGCAAAVVSQWPIQPSLSVSMVRNSMDTRLTGTFYLPDSEFTAMKKNALWSNGSPVNARKLNTLCVITRIDSKRDNHGSILKYKVKPLSPPAVQQIRIADRLEGLALYL